MVGSDRVILLQEAESYFHEITEIAEEPFHICGCADQLIMFHKNTSEPGVKTEEVIPCPSNPTSFGLKYLTVRSMCRRTPKHGRCTCTPASPRVSITIAKRRRNAKMLWSQFTEVAELNDVDIIGGDFSTSAHRERGKEKLRSIEELREETLLIAPPDLVPM